MVFPSSSATMHLLFICTVLLFSTVCARPAEQSWHGQSQKRAYQNYGSAKVQGGTATPCLPKFHFCILISVYLVNIGGWGVLEPWITPSIFESVDQSLGIVDEFTLCQNLPSQAADILNSHWSSFYTFFLGSYETYFL